MSENFAVSKPRNFTIAILDLATNGFNPETSVILECAVILVDAATLDVIDTTSVLVKPPPGTEAPDFHFALLQECNTSPNAVTISQLEGYLLAYPGVTTAGAICNRALDFDMKFIAKHMPTFHKALKFVLPIELKSDELRAVARGAAPFTSSMPRTYRAGDDAIAAYEELCHWTTNK